MKIFVTGPSGVGKTTLLKRVYDFAKEKRIKVCGFITEEVREGKFRVGFDLISLKDNKKFNFASIYKNTPYKFGKYCLDIDVLNNALDEIFCEEADIFILDEIGKMEFCSDKFRENIYTFLERRSNIIASLHRDFVKEFKKYGKIYYLTPDNRDIVFEGIKKEILSAYSL